MWKIPAVAALFVLLCLTLQTVPVEGGEADPEKLSGTLLLTGSSTMAPLMKEIGRRFQELHPAVRVEVQAGGSGRGISDAREGKAQVGMVSRALTDKERDLYGVPIARDGVCIVVHRNNPVRRLTDRQVVEIYTGRITNWKAVGGRKAPITVLNPKQGYSSAELFSQYFNIRTADIRADREVGDNPTRIRAVAEDANAISYVSIGEAERMAQTGIPIKLLPMDGVPATSRNIASGNFPIFRPLTLVTKALPTGLAQAFIEFSLTTRVNDLILAHDFVPYTD